MKSGLLAVSAVAVLALIAACSNAPTTALRSGPPILASRGPAPATCTLANDSVVSRGFGQDGYNGFGYNRCAYQFVGTFAGWCEEMGAADDCGGVTGNTTLIMKWNEAWDVGRYTGNWTDRAWLDNEINGALLDGTPYSEHFKTRWDATCAGGSSVGTDGGTCIWGAFEILMDQGTQDGVHLWYNNRIEPSGYGAP